MSSSFDRIWNDTPFTPNLDAADALDGPCMPAVAFQAWVDVLFEKQLPGATLLRLLQLQLHVTRKYFEWRTRLPEAHRQEDGREPDHTCVFTVFERSISELSEHELALAPPPLIQIVRPKEEPPERMDLLIFGDIDDTES